MRDLEQFRLINQKELDIINSSISKLNPNLREIINQNSKNLYISLTKSGSHLQILSVFLISDELSILINHPTILSKIEGAGVYFGFIKKGQFYLSLEGAEYLYLNNLIPNNRLLIINEEGEKSTLYGNNIKKQMIVKFPFEFEKNKIYLIINEQNELLAVSIAKVNSYEIPNLNPKDIIAKNLADKGKYLREKQ